MLAIQRPSMGSSKPPSYDLPFGYSFDTSSAVPFPSPPAHAPGPSLLDENDTKILDSFFDDVSSDHFNSDFLANAGDSVNDFGFGWQEPSQTFGPASSFGQEQLLPASAVPNASYANTNDPISTQPNEPTSNTTADVLAAATVLQNGHPSRPQRLDNEVIFTNHVLPVPPSSQANSQNMMDYGPLRARQIPGKEEDYIRDSYYSEMMFGPPASDGRPQPKAPPSPSKAMDIHWGSDTGFRSGQGFVAPPNQVSIEAIEQNMLHVVECLEPQASTASSTHPSSPSVSRRQSIQHSTVKDTMDNNDEQDGCDSRSKRRKKSTVDNDENLRDESPAALKTPRKRKPKPPSSTNQPSAMQSSPPAKRRKSTTSTSRHPRENLTEDQKRENHIRSEQKRRTLIKEGFEDLGELVPDLKGSGHSKSAALVMAADWLEDLINGNKLLRARLQELEGKCNE